MRQVSVLTERTEVLVRRTGTLTLFSLAAASADRATADPDRPLTARVALIGQPGLPGSGPAVNHQTSKLTGAQRLLEHLEFRTPADYRPALQRGRHSASMTSRCGKAGAR